MRFSVFALVRLIGLLALGFSIVAIAFSRANPEPPAIRIEAKPRFVGVNGAAFFPPDSTSYIFDTETSALKPAVSPQGDSLEYLCFSPWTDERGRFDVLGRLAYKSAQEGSSIGDGLTLALFNASGKRVISLPDAKAVMSGQPCWLPGTPAKVAFPAGDGLIHVQNFDADTDSFLSGEQGDSYVLKWACPTPGDGRVMMLDPIYPAIAELRGCIVVSLLRAKIEGEGSKFLPHELWWLKLDEQCRLIVAAGRLTEPAPFDAKASDADERLPNIVKTADGRLVAAYLRRFQKTSRWNLSVAQVRINPMNSEPHIDAASVRDLAQDCAVSLPPVSADGRWVFGIARSNGTERIRKFSALDALEHVREAQIASVSPSRLQ